MLMSSVTAGSRPPKVSRPLADQPGGTGALRGPTTAERVGVHGGAEHQAETRGPLRRALLLNATREPLCVVSVQRAVTLVLRNKAVVLESDRRLLRSEHLTLEVPQVLCLTRYVYVPYRGVVPPTRRTVLQRDRHRCAYCDGAADTVDHVLPRSRGGAHEWTNVVAACTRCNHRKADRLLSEIGWRLLFAPAPPRAGSAVLTAMARPHPSWSAYLPA